MSYLITGAICLLVGIVAGGILTALYAGKIHHQVAAELERFKAEFRARP